MKFSAQDAFQNALIGMVNAGTAAKFTIEKRTHKRKRGGSNLNRRV